MVFYIGLAVIFVFLILIGGSYFPIRKAAILDNERDSAGPKPSRSSRYWDHIARSMVAVGVAVCIAVVTVWFAYLAYTQARDIAAQSQIKHESEEIERANNLRKDELERDRLRITQFFRKSMLQYSFVAYQIKSFAVYCNVFDETEKFNEVSCRESATFASKAASLLPGVEFLFDQASKASPTFASANLVATHFVDADIALRGRLTSVIQENIELFIQTRSPKSRAAKSKSRSKSKPPTVDIVNRFTTAIENLKDLAESMGSILCIFSFHSNKSWDEFDKMLLQIEGEFTAIDKIQDAPHDMDKILQDRSEVIQSAAADLRVGNIDCADVRANLGTQLPGGGGGNGGGGG